MSPGIEFSKLPRMVMLNKCASWYKPLVKPLVFLLDRYFGPRCTLRIIMLL